MFTLKPVLAAVACLVFVVATSAQAQDAPQDSTTDAVTKEECKAIVDRIDVLLTQHYVFPDVAENAARHLKEQFQAGKLSEATDLGQLATQLTELLQSITHDKHMRVRLRPPARAELERESPALARAKQEARTRQRNYGFERVERLDGNVGYIDMRFFTGSPKGRQTAAAAMEFVTNSDALIFDMRKNGGGDPDMVRFVCSYLFDKPTHLNSLYWREGDRTQEFWTLKELPGPRMADVPVFVLTSDRTFSGAEEFAYNLQTRKRATLVGETTGGGANPGGEFRINDSLGVFIPTGRAINPVTGINWEGTGVKPDVATTAEEAYGVALTRAQKAAETYREAKLQRVEALLSVLAEQQRQVAALTESKQHDEAAKVLAAALNQGLQAGVLVEDDINMLGYEQLGKKHHSLAIVAFKFNVDAFPQSSNVYDSLGEAYMMDSQKGLAIKFYRRSLELDPGNKNAEEMIKSLQGTK